MSTILSSFQCKSNHIRENNNIPNDHSTKVIVPSQTLAEAEPTGPICSPNEANTLKRPSTAPDPDEEPQTKKPSSNPPKKFIYGNYDRYYGYRNPKNTHDIRLDVFRQHADSLFHDADVLDIGCNSGLVTLAVARDFRPRSVTGIDIDRSLIRNADHKLATERRHLRTSSSAAADTFQHATLLNVKFSHGNYVLADAKLLDIERPQFDTILCLSTSKWIHLNFGDAGLQLAFRRMFRQLRPGGQLVLEAQDWKSYKKRKRLSETIATHFAAIRMHPQQFGEYLLGAEVGFERSYALSLTGEHVAKGFRRPIQVFVKSGQRSVVDRVCGLVE